LNLRRFSELKDEASSLFKRSQYQAAMDKFRDCLSIDAYHLGYNATCHLNIALCQLKLTKFEDALASLNKSLQCNPQYAKALLKRGEVNLKLENYEEALRDLQACNNLSAGTQIP
jgi:DnaJ family protein C protein 7